MKKRNLLITLVFSLLFCFSLASCDVFNQAGMLNPFGAPYVYTVTFDTDGGSTPPEAQCVPRHVNAVQPAPPTKPGYSFKGWKVKDGDGVWDFTTSITSDITLIAIWEAQTLDVEFYAPGATVEHVTRSVVCGTPVAYPKDPTREGYRFVGWYYGDELWLSSAPVTQDMTLTARWELKMFTVTYSAPEGEPSIMTEQYTYGSSFSHPTTTPVREGYALVEWYLGDEQYDFTEGIVKDLTLTAKWAPLTSDDLFTYSFHRTSAGPCFHLESYGGEETDITVPESYFGYPVTEIVRNAFKDNTRLTSVYIPDTIKEINSATFEGCTELRTVTVDEDNPYLFEQDGVVYTKEQTQFVFIPKKLAGKITIPDGVTAIPMWSFHDRVEITEVVLPEGLTEIGDAAFDYCIKLEKINIPDSVTSIRGMAFGDCAALAEITLPQGITTITLYAFNGCTSLTELVIPEGVTTIEEWAFAECTSLERVQLPESLQTIGKYAFYKCASLKEIEIPDGLKQIDDYAFRNCSKLTSVILPASLETVGANAFDNALETVYFRGTPEEWAAVDTQNAALQDATVYYYSATQPTDAEHSYWRYVDGNIEIWNVA